MCRCSGAAPSRERTSCRYADSISGTIIVEYYRGWSGTAPQDGRLVNIPGLEVTRMGLGVTDPTHGWAMLDIRIRPWFLLVANIPFVLLSLLLAWPMLRRRPRWPLSGLRLRPARATLPKANTASRTGSPHPRAMPGVRHRVAADPRSRRITRRRTDGDRIRIPVWSSPRTFSRRLGCSPRRWEIFLRSAKFS